MAKYSNKSRIHTVYKAKDGIRVPGVTTVLGELAKPALIHWAWDLGIKNIDYRVHRDELADIGTLVHSMVLCDLKGLEPDTDEYSKMQIDKAENCFLSYLEWKRQRKIEPILIEESLVSEKHRFGGKMDYFGKIDGVLTLADFKTGKRLYDEHRFQLAGYKALLVENGFPPPDECLLLNIGRDENEKFEELKRKELGLESEIFFSALKIYKAKKWMKKGNNQGALFK